MSRFMGWKILKVLWRVSASHGTTLQATMIKKGLYDDTNYPIIVILLSIMQIM